PAAHHAGRDHAGHERHAVPVRLARDPGGRRGGAPPAQPLGGDRLGRWPGPVRMDRIRAREEAPARGLRGMQPMLFRLLIRAAPILVAGCGSPDAPGNVGREPTSQGEIAFEIPCSGACAFSPDGSWLYTCDGRSLRRIELGSGRTDASWRLEA